MEDSAQSASGVFARNFAYVGYERNRLKEHGSSLYRSYYRYYRTVLKIILLFGLCKVGQSLV